MSKLNYENIINMCEEKIMECPIMIYHKNIR